MKIKFNKYERVAGVFLLGALGGTLAFGIAVAIKKGFFEAKVNLETVVTSADGLHEGTLVTMQGLRVGSVTSVELLKAQEVLVKFEVAQKYSGQIFRDSKVKVFRPFIIGDKALDLEVVDSKSDNIVDGVRLVSEPSADIMDLVSGKTLGPSIDLLGKFAENLKYVAEAFMDPKRTQSLVKMFDELAPLLHNASSLTTEANALLKAANKNQNLAKTLQNLGDITAEIHKLMPALAKDSPEMMQHLAKIARNTAVLTDELQKTLPVVEKMAPEIPRASARALEALDETVITLKALQKSFILRGSVQDVRDEESRAKTRAPAQK